VDYGEAGPRLEGFSAQHLIADKGHDSDAIVTEAENQRTQCLSSAQALQSTVSL